MTRILRLLLIVAIALPMWQPAVAQNATGADPVMGEVSGALNTVFKVKKNAKPYEVIKPRGSVPEGYARVTFAVGRIWQDGFGYQMLLDKDATVYNNYNLNQYGSINNWGNNYLTAGSNTANNIYNACEYKIPENADPAANTQNVIEGDQATIDIPAGTYDYAITVHVNNRIGFATNRGDTPGRGDNFEFKSGASYVFYVTALPEGSTAYDGVLLDVVTPYMALLSGDGAFGDVQIGEAATATFTVMNTGEEPFTPVVNCNNPAFTISSNGSGLLASGASRNYVVTFAPTEMESYNGTFTLTAAEAEAAFEINASAQLNGTGLGEGQQGDPSGGDSQNAMFPIYTNNARYGTSSQMIYPASMLEAQGIKTGDVINSLTFYVQNNGTVNNNINRLNVTLRLGKTAATTVTSVNAMTTNRNNCTQVFSGTLTGGQNTLTVTLTTPYQYQGDNLIVDFDSEINNNSNYNFQTNWAGENGHTNASYNAYYRNYYSTNTTNTQGSFLPEVSIGYTTIPDLEATTSLDFGTVSIGNGKALTAIVKNLGSEDVQATLAVNDNPPFSVASSVVTIGANSFAIIPVTFMPKTEGNFTGTLTVVAGGVTTEIPLTGSGFYSGPEALVDPAYCDNEENGYTWPIVAADGMAANSKSSKLNEIATNPHQIIALLRKVYMDKNLPGNYKRGYTTSGGEDHDDDVLYSGVGTITSNNAATSADSYGWNIPGEVVNGGSYSYLDPNQYKPNEEGLTLLLVEMQDNFTKPEGMTTSTHNYTQLKDYIASCIRTVRVVTESRRVGEGIERGTMFKIDCDKMNKFYLLAKGQLLWFENQKDNIGNSNPVYYNGTYTDQGLAFTYFNGPAFLCHMFEQFSPSLGDATEATADLYRDLVNMESFGVIHDCPNVPFVNNGHHFMMYGSESHYTDCQDIRDLMFFIPDYRMMEHLNRGSVGYPETRHQDYFRYNTKHQPTMGLFVIKQDEIPEIKEENIITSSTETMTGLCKHQLSWKSNLDDFLPGEYQYYELWEIELDENDMERYVNVYERDNLGRYKTKSGTWVTDTTGIREDLVPVILPRELLGAGQEGFTYPNVYVDMKAGSQTRTYVIRGRDTDGFLSLQMSNPEDVFIPGLDPKEKARMIGATYYSRYNAESEMNCYSNRLELTNNGITLTTDDLNRGLKFYRSSRAAQTNQVTGEVITDELGNIQYVEETTKTLFATASATAPVAETVDGEIVYKGKITVTLVPETQNAKDDFPKGKVSGTGAGYHANETLEFEYTVVDNNIINFSDFSFWDNFIVKVDKNAHPLQYLYRMEIGVEGQEGYAYSNNVRVPIYKTDSRMNSYTLEQVNADVNGDLEVEDAKFGAKVQLSSKSDILRYDAYRWKVGEVHSIVETVDENGDEEDFDPTGQAGNQGDFYTVNMNVENTVNYYVASSEEQPKVSTLQPYAWATFVDYYPKNQGSVEEYTYAPVVELFTKGYKEEVDEDDNIVKVLRDDYNTYGGPLKNYAKGKLEVETVVPKDANGNNAVMTDYSWLGTDGNEYAYYTLNLNLKIKEVPESYQFYKVRAWHQVLDMNNNPKPEYLDEQYEALNYRKGNAQGKYKFEEITYPACNADASLGTWDPTELGAEQDPKSVGFTDDNGKPLNFTAGTFGARKIGVGNTEDFKIRYYVRIYFTLEDNMPSTTTNTGIHIKDETADNSGGVFYIVEDYADYVVNTSIPTSIKVFDSREVVGVKYYNVAGIESDTPFQGVNIVVTRYNDGSTTTTKIIK